MLYVLLLPPCTRLSLPLCATPPVLCRYTTAYMRTGHLTPNVFAPATQLGAFCSSHVWAHHVRNLSVLHAAYLNAQWPAGAPTPLPRPGPLQTHACRGMSVADAGHGIFRVKNTSLGHRSGFPDMISDRFGQAPTVER